MKLNIANPPTGAQKLIEIEDEKKLRLFMERRMADEVRGDELGEEFKGYVFRITGGNDKQGFPMKQGILSNGRVRLLFSEGHSCYRPRRSGERKRKSVRGCIVGPDLAVIALTVVKQGDADIPGLTDREVPRRLGPKRANKIRKLFNLSKDDDVRRYVVRREITKQGKKKTSKAPKIQRLVTPLLRQRKRRTIALRRKAAQKGRTEAQEYAKLVGAKNKEKRRALISKRREMRSSVAEKKSGKEEPKEEKTKKTKGGAAAPKGGAAAPKGGAAAPKGGAAAQKPAAAAPKEQKKGGGGRGAAAPAATQPPAAAPAAGGGGASAAKRQGKKK